MENIAPPQATKLSKADDALVNEFRSLFSIPAWTALVMAASSTEALLTAAKLFRGLQELVADQGRGKELEGHLPGFSDPFAKRMRATVGKPREPGVLRRVNAAIEGLEATKKERIVLPDSNQGVEHSDHCHTCGQIISLKQQAKLKEARRLLEIKTVQENEKIDLHNLKVQAKIDELLAKHGSLPA